MDGAPLEALLRQYDCNPYPSVALGQGHDLNSLWLHSFSTGFYRRHRRLPPARQLRILDAGCGSGYTTLALAQANPGARITGIDLSPRSVEVARERLAHHGFSDANFHALPIERAGELGETFDFINCDEVLYLLPDPAAALAALGSVLAPDGLIRTNLHSAFARAAVFRAQKLFQIMGLVSPTPGLEEMAQARETMDALNNSTHLKLDTWIPCIHLHEDLEWYQMNYLLQGDRGFTIPQTFRLVEGAGLAFISMTLWPAWDVTVLFQDPDELPPLFARGLAERSLEERLHLYELIHSPHRLIDFWCGHPRIEADWSGSPVWENGRIHLHPSLRSEKLRTALVSAPAEQPFELQHHIHYPYGEALPTPAMAGALLPLWDGPLSIAQFEQHWAGFARTHGHPEATAAPEVARQYLSAAERLLYLLFEPISTSAL
ncbi:class I SAM-dependent methyltransferase [Gloeobacter kilaueensis]|uniref:Ubiquinone/menaquinone biosynthesis methyltransferase n=1 Tax=Gloeobacter kilaueensis (strain ATCC BAA-2537 / CCAP 1431/1 / ULC 316 / JS1) TaxID=1183438 RepID=U5QC52_GLOK1|nr:class I SAM-dependent methyltransferase [Gloeobacter kilaueensis]AGY56426.1 ubiquinone/menaquinone biosynthesis methyltransferase [Gloeobacter kilaueensis JS1]